MSALFSAQGLAYCRAEATSALSSAAVSGRRIERRLLVEVVDAADGRARVHAAGIEAHDVEALAQCRREDVGVGALADEFDARAPGPPGLTMSDPIRPLGSVAGSSKIEMFMYPA